MHEVIGAVVGAMSKPELLAYLLFIIFPLALAVFAGIKVSLSGESTRSRAGWIVVIALAFLFGIALGLFGIIFSAVVSVIAIVRVPMGKRGGRGSPPPRPGPPPSSGPYPPVWRS